MCTNGGDSGGEEFITAKTVSSAGVAHKFRANFGRAKCVLPGSNALVIHFGGVEEFVLLTLLNDWANEAYHKKLRFTPKVLYIDEGPSRPTEERRQIAKRVLELSQAYGFPIYAASLSDVMISDEEILPQPDLLINSERDESLALLLESVKSETSRRDLLTQLKRKLILKCAKKLDCGYVLSAETATELAINSLVNISLGGGLHVQSEIGFIDDRDEIRILRPLRDMTSEELNSFVELKQISSIIKTDDNPPASIQSCIQKFILDLRHNYPSTVSTIVKTSNKLEVPEKQKNEEKCVICDAVIDVQEIECSALQAVNYSKKISSNQQQLQQCSQVVECDGCNCTEKTKTITKDSVETFSCYRCRLMLKSIPNVQNLPPSIIAEVASKQNRLNMKEAIQDFLL